jgi:signal transduction histidine kinase
MPGDAIERARVPTQAAGKPYALVVLLQLHWFIRLRWLFAAGMLAVLAIERFVLPESRRPWQLLLIVVSLAAVNIAWTVISRLLHRQLHDPAADQRVTIRSGQLFVSAQVGIDLLLLTWILALTGGVENPMSLFYLFHVAISGLLLRTWQAFLQSCWAILLYGLMCLGQAQGWLAYYPFLPHLGPSGLHQQPQHVVMVVLVVAFAILATLYFMDRIGKILNRREEMLMRANAALEQSRQAIQDLQRRRSRFMQTAAHQLKSPLAMAQTLSNLIRDGIVADSQSIQATCEKIARRCGDGIAQVTELLALARVQEADPRRHQESLSDVGRVVTELCTRHAPVAHEKHLDLSWEIPESADLVAHVDRVDLSDCINNLIENAIKYTPAGGSVRVAVLAGRQAGGSDHLPAPPARVADHRRVEDYIYVIVRDTGIGLDDSTPLLENGSPADGSIFDPFRRGSTAVAAGIPGTGLGLSIVREVVEQSGGYIHVHSRRGEGSTFTVCFPARAAEPGTSVRDTRSSEIVVEGKAVPSADAERGEKSGPR